MVVERTSPRQGTMLPEFAVLLLVALLSKTNPIQTTRFGNSFNGGVPGLIAVNAFTTNGYDTDGDGIWDTHGPATYVAGSVNILNELNIISAFDLINPYGYAVANSNHGDFCGAALEVDSANGLHLGPMEAIRVAGQDTYCIPGN